MDIEKNQTTTMKDSMTKPYREEVRDQHGTGIKYVIRTFENSVLDNELVWHRDRDSRIVSVLNGSGWELQHDDELPIQLNQGEEYYIPKMTYHRLIKGKDNLVVRIRIT
jgi:hypothetical protein